MQQLTQDTQAPQPDFEEVAQVFRTCLQHADIVSINVNRWYKEVSGCKDPFDLGIVVCITVKSVEASAIVCSSETQELAAQYGASILVVREYGIDGALNDLSRVTPSVPSDNEEAQLSLLKLRLWLEYLKHGECLEIPGPGNLLTLDGVTGAITVRDSNPGDVTAGLPRAVIHRPHNLEELHALVLKRRKKNSKRGVFDDLGNRASVTRYLGRPDEAAEMYELLIGMVPLVFGLPAVPGVYKSGDDLDAWTHTIELRQYAAQCFEQSGQIYRACIHLANVVNMYGPSDAIDHRTACGARLKLIGLLLQKGNLAEALKIGRAIRALLPHEEEPHWHLRELEALFERHELGQEFTAPLDAESQPSATISCACWD